MGFVSNIVIIFVIVVVIIGYVVGFSVYGCQVNIVGVIFGIYGSGFSGFIVGIVVVFIYVVVIIMSNLIVWMVRGRVGCIQV